MGAPFGSSGNGSGASGAYTIGDNEYLMERVEGMLEAAKDSR